MLGLLILANLKMMLRNRQALFWALVFPLIFVVIFGLFNLDKPPVTHVAIVDRSQDAVSTAVIRGVGALENFTAEVFPDEGKARAEVRDGEQELLIILPPGLAAEVAAQRPVAIPLVYEEGDPVAARSAAVLRRFLDQVNLVVAKAPVLLSFETESITARRSSYFDFLLPGFVGMGVMTYAVIGLASALSVYREQKIFKRILATPLRVSTYFTGLVLSYLLLSLIQAGVILAAGVFILGGRVHGNLLQLGLIVLLANTVFLCIGFIVGAYVRTVSAASGLGNAVTMPMMFLSGTFFPLEQLPRAVANVVSYLPLAAMLNILRGIALHSQSFWEFPKELAILLAWVAVLSLLAVRVFRFRT